MLRLFKSILYHTYLSLLHIISIYFQQMPRGLSTRQLGVNQKPLFCALRQCFRSACFEHFPVLSYAPAAQTRQGAFATQGAIAAPDRESHGTNRAGRCVAVLDLARRGRAAALFFRLL